MVLLTRKIEFSASHRYDNPEWSPEENRRVFGKCNNPHGHGHNYTLEVTVAGEPSPVTGMVLDFSADKKRMAEAASQRRLIEAGGKPHAQGQFGAVERVAAYSAHEIEELGRTRQLFEAFAPRAQNEVDSLNDDRRRRR